MTANYVFEIARVHAENFRVYGVDKIWAQLNRDGIRVARCTVARLMRDLGLRGAMRGKPKRTAITDDMAVRLHDLVDRQFTAPAPNRLWVADLTYVRTWSGFVRIDEFRRVYHRCLLASDRRLASLPIIAIKSRLGCVGAGDLDTQPCRASS